MRPALDWDATYRNAHCLWGSRPDGVLIRYAQLIPEGKVLDLGVGEGRNILPFARMEYEVEGIDVSPTAIERCLAQARAENLRISVEAKDLRDMVIAPATYSLIIAAWVLNFLGQEETAGIIEMLKRGLKMGGLAYVAVFSVDDPGVAKARQNLELAGVNTFYSPKRDTHVHYFIKEEILASFLGFRAVYCAEGRELDLTHGEPHEHGFIQYVGQKVG